MAEKHSQNELVFVSSALEPGELFLLRMEGVEGLSRIYEFNVEVQTVSGLPLDPGQVDKVMGAGAYLAFGAEAEHKIFGAIRRVEMLSFSPGSPARYRLRMVPNFHDLQLTFGSWVYQDQTVQEIVKDVMTEASFEEGTHFEFRLTKSYGKREYTVQYQETDFDFVSRLCEYEGIFYYFEHGDECEKVIFTDKNSAFNPLSGHESIPYDTRQGMVDQLEVITALSRVQTTIPGKMKLRDYNYRMPSVQLKSEVPIDANGIGQQVYYGEHFKTPDDGKKLVKIRAEEVLVRRLVFNGASRVRGLRAGHKFSVEQHPFSALDMEYVVTELRHSVAQSPEGTDVDSRELRGYSNTFVAIPAAIQFRPQRTTRLPKIYGFTHAKIDAGSDDGVTAPLDDQGRYKVLMPYDVGGEGGTGKASRWVRMAQSSAGGGYGMHFPLHVGTEVLIVHLDGDPDRPVIVGAVPNAETASPVSSANATQSQIKTRTGIVVRFDDSA